ncbi:MAG: class I SAM-dependent methyltransferase [Bermanella sp.]
MKLILLAILLCSTHIMAEPLRSPENIARDKYRNPIATLAFFEVKPHHKVTEIWPGGGWYSEILAPMLFEEGTFVAAHFPIDSPVAFFRNSRNKYEARVSVQPEFSKIQISTFAPPNIINFAEKNSMDRVLTFRNVHNWMRNKGEQSAFNSFYKALKPGGILGVVEHRAPNEFSIDKMIESGYVTEAYVIKLAENAGFKLLDKSEINANKKDKKLHPKGVWTLPPSLRLGEQDKKKYLNIGESDRMTLKFIKPLKQ